MDYAYDKFGNSVVCGDLLIEGHGYRIRVIELQDDTLTCVHWQPAHIQTRAYYLWMKAGCPHGQDQRFWFQAERESNCFRISKRRLLNSPFQKV